MSFLPTGFRCVIVLAFIALGLKGAGADDKIFTPPSSTVTDPKIEARVDALLAKMTQDEKITLIGGRDVMHTQPIARLGIPSLKFSDGPVGVRCWGQTTAYPAVALLAATWDPEAALALGTAMGRDARARGVHVLLAPGVNIYREAQCGRNFEYMGEDPFLASALAVPYIKGIQEQGVSACIKHYVCNEEETQRSSMNMIVGQRALREIYLPPFLAAIKQGGVWTAMAAYNKVNGDWCTANKFLLTDILRDQWHFQGVLTSDWGATHDTLGPLNAGLDLEMDENPAHYYTAANILPLLASGQVTPAVLDEHVRRMLRLMVSMGFLDRDQSDTSIPLDDPASSATAQRLAAEGIVLLKNEKNLLPLDRTKTKRLVVMGPNADPAVIGGGGSSGTQPFASVSVLQALQKVAGEGVDIHYIANSSSALAAQSVFTVPGSEASGVTAEYFDNAKLEGAPVARQTDSKVDFNWGHRAPVPGVTGAAFSVRWKGTITPKETAEYALVASSDDGSRVFLDDKKILDMWSAHPLEMRSTRLKLEKGHRYQITVEYFNTVGEAEMHFGWGSRELSPADRDLISAADAVIYAGGLNPSVEHEGSDRTWLMPDGQALEIDQIAALNPRLILAVNAGGNLSLKEGWGKIPALLWAWYPGQNGNLALAQIIFGEVNPSGRLPDTFEKQVEDSPGFHFPADNANGGSLALGEGVYVGYRWYDKKAIEPAFPFGFGLSYTTFDLKSLAVMPEGEGKDRRLTVSVKVTNTGIRGGSEVVQLYVHPVKSGVDRPVQELKGFDRVTLKAGETKAVTLVLTQRDFATYDEKSAAWVVPPGKYQLAIGRSSRDICGTLPVTW